MLNIVPPLLVLLSLVGGNAAQEFGTCDYEQNVVPGIKYHIFNANYPQLYPPGSACRWVAKSSQPIQLTCNTFELPTSIQCIRDAVIIQDALPASVERRYCGNATFSFLSQSNQLTVTLETSAASQGGKFVCTVETIPKKNETESCRCGWKNSPNFSSRIVGGEDAGVNEYPMMAGLVNAGQRMVFCGATIINEKQVLTAAHCVTQVDMSVLGVLVGDQNLAIGSETNATRLFRVNYTRIHPQYNAITRDYDVALVAIRGTISFSQQVGPVCLPFQHYSDTFAGGYVDVLGWGTIQNGGPISDTLQKARLSVITNAECKRTASNLTPRHLCTYAEGRDSCQFDSGGPILWESPSTQRIVLIGMVSFGRTCAYVDPATNTRVGEYVDWIVANTIQGITYCRLE